MMLLDEPMAGMGHEDINRTAELIRRVSVGRTILMVEHNLNVVADMSDTITVLTRGSILAEGRSEEHTSELQSLMLISYAVFCLKKKIKSTPIHQTLSNYTRELELIS